MNEQRQCPNCGRILEVDEQGAIPTWRVVWSGLEYPPPKPKPRYLSEQRRARLEELRAKYGKSEPEVCETSDYGKLSHRDQRFIHYEDAQDNYNWLIGLLMERGDWSDQQEHLALIDGERMTWHELEHMVLWGFGEPEPVMLKR